MSNPTKLAGGSRNSLVHDIIVAAAKKYPDVPSRTLARMLMQDHPRMWHSLEVARKAVCLRRGKMGKAHRKKYGVVESTCPSVPHDPYAIPKSEEQSFDPYTLGTRDGDRALVLSDIHVPYHNTVALKAALVAGKKRKPNVVILNGDTLDFYKLSRFLKDPTKRDTKKEIELCNQLLDTIDGLFPKARKIWKDGNHDERLSLYLMVAAPELYRVAKDSINISKLLLLEERGWEYVTSKRPIYAGKLTLLHGHEYPTPVLGPVNAARGLFLRTKESALVGHHHQTSEHTEPTVRGGIITTWSTGCLCELHPEYARFNKWNHGFAEIDFGAKGAYQLHNHRIYNGKIL